MSGYIDADALFEQLCKTFESPEAPKINTSAALVISGIIQGFPAADVAPVLHAKAVLKHGLARCTACDGQTSLVWPYCPNCGAKMDKEDDQQ